MLFRLFLLFTVVPSVELYLLFKLAAAMGAAETVALVIVTGIVGSWLAKREGLSVVTRITQEAQAGFPSGDGLLEGALVLAGGLLLVTPGVLTDLTGFLLILPPSRKLLAPALKRWLLKNVKVVQLGQPRPGPGAGRPPTDDPKPLDSGDSPFDHPVV